MHTPAASASPAAPRTYEAIAWTVPELIAAKAGRTVSVVLPALNEEATVAGVIASIAPLTSAASPSTAASTGTSLVDDLILMDSGSTDNTRAVAAAAGYECGLQVHAVADVLTGPGGIPDRRPGKGEALWRSLAVATGDIIAFVDTDLHNPSPDYVPGILGPLLLDPDIVLTKGYYQRPYRDGRTYELYGGGRVTELTARPLLRLLRPGLEELRQPLAGEYAVRRDFAEAVPFAAEYGVEMGLVLDAARLYGPQAIAQVNLGVREHRHRSLQALAGTSAQVMETAFRRLGIQIGRAHV